MLGLYAAQRPRIGTLGLVGAVGYAYAFVFFTGTVLLARARHIRMTSERNDVHVHP